MTSEPAKESSSDMADVKKLLILQLLVSGVKQKHIAAMLGISDATMSRMLPSGLAKELGKS